MKAIVALEEGDADVDPVILATKLSSVGHRVHIRSALGGSSGTTSCFFELRNEFLVVYHSASASAVASPFASSCSRKEGGEDPQEEEYFIVEPRFRDHFAIPQPTPRYSGLLQAIPQEVAAPPSVLTPLVHLLCSEMSLAFQEQGLSLPPWRQSKSLLSKWLPAKARDMDLEGSPLGSPRPRSMSPDSASPRMMVTAFTPAPTPTPAPITTATRGLVTLSTSSSGNLTPSFVRDDDSPRAVLRHVAAVLSNSGTPSHPHLRPPPPIITTQTSTKQRSLLSADLAASGASTPQHRPDARSPKSVHSATTTTATATAIALQASGWTTAPIRTVRMAGAPSVA